MTYTADVGDATSVSIVLANPNNVSVGDNGVVSFTRLGAAANFGSVTGLFINQINGTSVGTTTSASAVPAVNGTVTFRVNANSNGSGYCHPGGVRGVGRCHARQ